MPTPTDPRVDAYIAKAAPFAQPILRHLRKLVRRACPGAVETIKWGCPGYETGGKILCGMAAFKAHAAFGFRHLEMEKLIERERGTVADAMWHLGRLTRPADLPDDTTLLRYLKTAVELNASAVPSRPRAKVAKKPLPVPPDLAAALKRNPAAAATFAGLPPGHRREYVEWILEAKRPETRAKRLATTLEWLAEGKRRNWKYENC